MPDQVVEPAPALRPELDPGPDDTLVTGEAVALDLRPTGFALSAAGAAIDFVLYFGAYVVSIVVLATIAASARAGDSVYGIIAVLSLVLCIAVAPMTVETLSHGKSLGRLAVGARIVRDDGGAIGFRHAAIRALAGVLEIFFTFGSIAALVGLLSPRTKRLGDLLAGTYSQYERVPKGGHPVFGLPTGMEGWAATADVARMPDGLGRRIAQFLAQAPQYEPGRRAALAASLTAEATPYVAPLPDVPAELLLAGVVVVRREREARALALEARRLAELGPALDGLPHGFPAR
ncbi:MAG TPA: RDD family protein [Pseudolysinimonas sp.]|nr:RDD family protein [Pseudolysinimonas sp.]